MRKRAAIVLGTILCLFLLPVLGQETGSLKDKQAASKGVVSGYVQDTAGGRLAGVEIKVKGTKVAAITDEQGNFVLRNLTPGSCILIASLMGFQEKEVAALIQAGQDANLNITLELATQEFAVYVTSTVPKLMSAAESIGEVQVVPSQLATLPSLGEKDIFRSLQLMPGVSATNESSSGLYVRGGTPDQNLVLLDGFTVFNVNHFFGVFSAFNANAIDTINMYKGGFEAKYGGRMSGVVDMTGRGADRKEMAWGGGVGLMSYNGYWNGPLGKNGSYMFAGRRSYQSPLSNKIRDNYTSSGQGGFNEFTTQPESWFYDLNGRVTLAPTAHDTVVLSFFNGVDTFDNSHSIERDSQNDSNVKVSGTITNLEHWGNSAGSFQWKHIWNPNYITNLTVSGSRYFKNMENSSEMESSYIASGTVFNTMERSTTEGNKVYDTSLCWHNLFTPISKHIFEFGAEYTRNSTRYDYLFDEDTGSVNRKTFGTQYVGYAQDRWQLHKNFELTAGLRATYYDLAKNYFFEPRMSFILHLTDKFRLKGAGGQYRQFVRNLTREDAMQGDKDFWVMADGELAPLGKSNHYIFGGTYETNKWLFDVEAYYKKMTGLAEFASMRMGRMPPPDEEDEERDPIDMTALFFKGVGDAKGVEFLAQKKFGNHTGWLTYTLSNVRYNIRDLNDGYYNASHDSTHEIKLVDSYAWRNFVFSGSMVYASGKPFTEPTGVETYTWSNDREFSLPTIGQKNGSRLPSYQRLDLSATWNFYTGETNSARLGFSVFNVYNHANIWRRQYDAMEDELYPTDINYLGATASVFLSADLGPPSYGTRGGGPAWWTKEEAEDRKKQKVLTKKEEVYDFYGTVIGSTPGSISVRTKKGVQDFQLLATTLKGENDYETGAFVHVYYQRKDNANQVTQIFRKVDRSHPDRTS